MPYVLVIMFIVSQPGTLSGRIDHIDSIRFDDEHACKNAASWLTDRVNSTVTPGQPSPNNLRMECLPAR